MRRAIIMAILALAACDAVELDTVSLPVSQHRSAESFDIAVSRVLPEAAARCRALDPSRSCDFQIVVDDRPGRAPNAFQSLGADGDPVLTFTAALIAGARNPDEIALIVAHEAAHHIDGHLAQVNRKVALALGQDDPPSPALGAAQDAVPPAGAWSDVHASLRAFELAADARAAEIVTATGFDAMNGAEIFLRLPAPPAHATASHPANAERVRAVRRARSREIDVGQFCFAC